MHVLALVKGLTAIVLLGLFNQVHAACRADDTRGPQQLSFTFARPTITFPRDAPIGTVIASVQDRESNSGGAFCQSGRTTLSTISPMPNVIQNTSTATTGIQGVYIIRDARNANSGIGFRIVETRGGTAYLTRSILRNIPTCPGSPSAYCAGISYQLGNRLEIVKTADSLTLRTLNSQSLFQGTAEGILFSETFLASTLTFTPQTCTVTQPGAVNMGAVSSRTFTGVGSTSDWGPDFTIGVNCSGVAAKVFMVLSDAQNNANTSSTLPLSSSSTAAGVGLQIQRKNGSAPISFGPDSSLAGTTNQFPVFTSDGSATGPTALVFAARYIQTNATITPGTANGLATFTMSYQ